MKTNTLLSFALLLILAITVSACKLPSPTTATPSVPDATGTTTLVEGTAQPTPGQATPTTAPKEDTGEQLPTATPLAVTETPAPPPQPSATPMPAVDTGDAQRIQFPSGSTSASFDGELDSGQSAKYVLQVSANQTLSADVWSPNGDVYLEITGASDGKVLVDDATKSTFWTGIIPTSQDYLITLAAGDGRTSYSLQVVSASQSTAPTPTGTVVAGQRLDPYAQWGEPDFVDPFSYSSKANWEEKGTDKLPNNELIMLEAKDQDMYVTGKQPGFSTWWFSYPNLNNFYIQINVGSEACVSNDSYGLIVRGPEHGAGVSYGYVAAFSCDGSFWVFRLDGVNPWRAQDLVSWTKSSYIQSGPNIRNTLGIQAEGSTLTIYANGYQIAQVTDDHFTAGRYGVFVMPSINHWYTYRAVQLEWWDLNK